jgi:hypothetical protein
VDEFIDFSTWPTTENQFIGGDSGEQGSQGDGVGSNYDPWPPVEAHVASGSALQHARAPTTHYSPSYDFQNFSAIPEDRVEPLSEAELAMLPYFPIPGSSPRDTHFSLEEYIPSLPNEYKERTDTQS